MASKKVSESDALQDAFALVDKLGSRLDDLKHAYNKNAKQIANLNPEEVSAMVPTTPPPAPPTEDLPPVVIPPPPPNAGRYAISTPLATEEIELPKKRPPIPRPRPRVAPTEVAPPAPVTAPEVPKRKVSGRFYLEVRLGGSDNMADLRTQLAKVGRIVDSGNETATARDRAWVEIATTDDVSALIDKLRLVEVREKVEKVIEVPPGEGRLQAKNMDLFVSRSDSLSKK